MKLLNIIVTKLEVFVGNVEKLRVREIQLCSLFSRYVHRTLSNDRMDETVLTLQIAVCLFARVKSVILLQNSFRDFAIKYERLEVIV